MIPMKPALGTVKLTLSTADFVPNMRVTLRASSSISAVPLTNLRSGDSGDE
jgi:hypothetical protein